jgi:hypothetical protein
MRFTAVRALWAGFSVDPATSKRPAVPVMAAAAALGAGLSIVILVLGFAFWFPFYEGPRALLALALVPLVSYAVLLLSGIALALRRGRPFGETAMAAAYSAAPVVLLQSVLAVAMVAPWGRLETREMELALALVPLVLSLTWGATLLHSAWLAWLGLPSRLSMPIAGLAALVAQALAYWCWAMAAGEGLAFDERIFF